MILGEYHKQDWCQKQTLNVKGGAVVKGRDKLMDDCTVKGISTELITASSKRSDFRNRRLRAEKK